MSPATAKPLVEVRNLTKRYGALTAISDVSFSIRSGEILGLIGPNGSGKTTLMECMAGVQPANSGGVYRNGKLLTHNERARTLFYLPDAIAPWAAQPVGGAIDYGLGFFGGRSELRDDVVRRLEIQPLLHKAIGSLSKGQRKRALLAIGLLTPQALLLADEPFEGLDLRQTRELAATLRSYASVGPGISPGPAAQAAAPRTMLLSIHQIADAARVCDRFVLLSGGRIRGEGTVAELAQFAEQRGHAVTTRDLEEVFLALT